MNQEAAPYQFIKIPGRLDLATAADSALLLGQILADGRHCLLEMESVKSIDSTGVGLLIRLQKTLSTAGRQLILVAPSRPVRRALTLMHLNEFFASAPDFADAQKLIEARLSERATVVSLGTLAAARPLQWRGEITAANAEEVWKLTQAYLETILVGVESEIEIDLSSVRFIDSSGLGLMVRSKKLAQRRGAELSFTGVQPAVRNVLHLARLDGFLAKKQHRNLTARVAVTTAIEEPLAIK
jgi:anti-anti-sigma factor